MAKLTPQRQAEIDAVIDDIKLKTGLSYPENGLLQISQALGIDIYEVDLDQGINGAIEYISTEGDLSPRIVLNKSFSPQRKTFTLAHEIGHYHLHNKENKFRLDFFDYKDNSKESIEESEANYFAAAFLVPKDKLIQVLELTSDLDAVSKYFAVSRAVIENRLKWIAIN